MTTKKTFLIFKTIQQEKWISSEDKESKENKLFPKIIYSMRKEDRSPLIKKIIEKNNIYLKTSLADKSEFIFFKEKKFIWFLFSKNLSKVFVFKK